jgi:hypothetical protein
MRTLLLTLVILGCCATQDAQAFSQVFSSGNQRSLLTSGSISTCIHRVASVALHVSSTSPSHNQKDASSSSGESEVERLLRMARKLREQAEEEEQQVHEHLYRKKREQNEQLDQWIQNLTLASKQSTKVINELNNLKPCMDTLEKIVDRLHEHHMIASGHECVEAPTTESKQASSKDVAKENIIRVQRVKHEKDDVEVEKVELKAEALFSAIQILDEETSGNQDPESRHWGGDRRAQRLRDRWHGLLREHAEQFLERQESFFEAQRIKKDNVPPPKVKDNHRLLP